MDDVHRGSAVIRWWATIAVGTAAALLIAWLASVTGVPLRAVLSVAAGAVALGWLIVLVAVPWNLYFAARLVVAETAVSRERGIVVQEAREAEARRIARRMLWFAVGGHIATAAVTAVITYSLAARSATTSLAPISFRDDPAGRGVLRAFAPTDQRAVAGEPASAR